MQTSRWDFDKLSHRAVDAVSESFAIGIEIVTAGASHRAVRINHRGGFAAGSIAFFPARDVLAHRVNVSGELMTEHHRIIHGPRMLSRPLMQIASAHTNRADFQKDVFTTDLWNIQFLQLDAMRRRRKIHDTHLFHWSQPSNRVRRYSVAEFIRTRICVPRWLRQLRILTNSAAKRANL